MSDPEAPERPRAPAGLLVAMLVCFVMAVGGSMGGCRDLRFYSAGQVDEPALVAGVDPREQEALTAFARADREARNHARRYRLPLATANLLLSSLLLFGAARAFGGRPGVRGLVSQAIGANAALAVVDYVLNRDFRGELIPAMVTLLMKLNKQPSELPEAEQIQAITAGVWTMTRLQLFASLAAYAVALLALSTDRAKAYLVDREEDEDDDG